MLCIACSFQPTLTWILTFSPHHLFTICTVVHQHTCTDMSVLFTAVQHCKVSAIGSTVTHCGLRCAAVDGTYGSTDFDPVDVGDLPQSGPSTRGGERTGNACCITPGGCNFELSGSDITQCFCAIAGRACPRRDASTCHSAQL